MPLHLKSVHVLCACQNYADLLGIRLVGTQLYFLWDNETDQSNCIKDISIFYLETSLKPAEVMFTLLSCTKKGSKVCYFSVP